jgi:hypothetical protein
MTPSTHHDAKGQREDVRLRADDERLSKRNGLPRVTAPRGNMPLSSRGGLPFGALRAHRAQRYRVRRARAGRPPRHDMSDDGQVFTGFMTEAAGAPHRKFYAVLPPAAYD